MPIKCEACGGKGWLVTQSSGSRVYGDDSLHIERCDSCDKYEDDVAAEKAYVKALADGVEELPDAPLTLYDDKPTP